MTVRKADKPRETLEDRCGRSYHVESHTLGGCGMLGKRDELNLCHVGPFNHLGRIGNVTYKHELPNELGNVHDVIYVSNLKKRLSDETLVVPLLSPKVNNKLQLSRKPIEIMDQEVKVR
ncbi:uncharacterized protein LOC118491252 [Helianthus annuus]|uniref:uncharacterized protein LOC118491252 n=1 Tax=Helianthus annuus TaxID=4232 RepID=UPI001653323E|nr:uncharacterized protein LOC118491252 [Helianthus annuus]